MEAPPFVHLHVHTHYSLLDGACKIPQLVKRTKELGMDSIAITDHGCMFGVVEFFNECKKEGVKPILGMEGYMAPGDRRDKSTGPGESAYHLLLLAQDLEGYKNLIKLSSIAYREGFYYKPRIDKAVLREYSKGLICTSACLGGEVCSAFMKRDGKAARKAAETYLEIFGPERFFIEIQKQGINEQDVVNPELADLAEKAGIGLIATNDVHFLNKDDHYAHDVLCCISMGRLVNEENRLKYPTELYLKSPGEMGEIIGKTGLARWREAMENTARVAKMCNCELDFSKRYAPVYRVPQEKLRSTGFQPVGHGLEARATLKEDELYLRQLCEEGLEWRYGTREVSKEIRDRLEYELSVIVKKNFCSYFLIVWDFCNYARDNGIPVGARGSGVGTMVGYLLGLCNVDPIRYNLLFERFMDPSRNEMPDIDIDICQDGRQKVIEYVRNKYGHVAQIVTFNTLAARAACKDVGRVLGVPLAEIDKLTKLIPGTPGMTLKKAMEQNPELSDLYKGGGQLTQVLDLAMKLEGMARNAGCHAAGVIIADQPLDEIVPLYKDKDDNILTQFEGPLAEKCGLLKMDFLGLRTLSTLTRAIELERQTREQRGEAKLALPHARPPVPYDAKGQIDIEKIDITDQNVFEMFQRGESKGIFQFESGGMQDLLMKMRPDRIEDLIAANALYRPGPMELIPLYCNRKHGAEAVPKVHPIMDRILEETFGIMTYQEQVMQIFNQLGGIELSNAYKLIKAISKKQSEVIAKFQPDFMKGAMAKGVSKDKAEEIFDLILKFGGYGFNKSHSTRYAFVAYQTAYMKVYHPVEYMSALLTFEMGSTEKVVEYIEECRRMPLPEGRKGVRVLPPDVNVSDKDFTPVYEERIQKPEGRGQKKQKAMEGVIRFGMMAVRGVGEGPVEAIIEERERKGRYGNIFEFCERVDLRAVQKATIEALVKCGAFASLGANRAQLLAVVEKAVEMGQQTQNDRRNGQLNMFGGGAATAGAPPAPPPALPVMEELPNAELLKFEKELLGFYITSHPLTEHQAAIERYSSHSTKDVMGCSEGTEVTVGGMVNRVKTSITKSGRSAGQKMAWITLEDLEGTIDGVIWAEQFTEIAEKHPGVIAPEQIIFLKARVDRKRETPSLVINEVIPIDTAVSKLTTSIVLRLAAGRHAEEHIEKLKPVMKANAGRTPVFASVALADGKSVILKLGADHGVRPAPALVNDLELVLGDGGVQLVGAGTKRKKVQQQPLFQPAETEAGGQDAGAPPQLEAAEAMDGE